MTQPYEGHQPKMEPFDPQEAPHSRLDGTEEETAARSAKPRFDHRQFNFYQQGTTRCGRKVIRPDYLAGHSCPMLPPLPPWFRRPLVFPSFSEGV